LTVENDGSLSIVFLGRSYRIDANGVTPTDGQPVHANILSVLAYYILSKGTGDPAFYYVPISYHTGTDGLVFSSNIKWMTDPLGREFNKKYDAFSKTMRQLGAYTEGSLQSETHYWFLTLLPKIPVQIIYHEADDEFPCDIQILFDRQASQFLEFECLAFLQGCLVKAISMTARTGNTSGWI
jgi:hypothetical protein